MGERANVVVIQSAGAHEPLYLYTHWGGYELPETLRIALARRERWGDEQYLARIIFCTMVGPEWERETGFGLSTSLHDNGYPLLVVDCSSQRVACIEWRGDLPKTLAEDDGWSFEDYCALDLSDDGWERLKSRAGSRW